MLYGTFYPAPLKALLTAGNLLIAIALDFATAIAIATACATAVAAIGGCTCWGHLGAMCQLNSNGAA